MLLRNAHWLHRSEATECSLCNIRDGVRQRNTPIGHLENTGDLTNVGMEKEDLGRMMFMF